MNKHDYIVVRFTSTVISESFEAAELVQVTGEEVCGLAKWVNWSLQKGVLGSAYGHRSSYIWSMTQHNFDIANKTNIWK